MWSNVDATRGIVTRVRRIERSARTRLADTSKRKKEKKKEEEEEEGKKKRENSQPCEKYARKVPTYLQMRNHKDMHHVYATLETILPDLSLFNYFGCILKCN